MRLLPSKTGNLPTDSKIIVSETCLSIQLFPHRKSRDWPTPEEICSSNVLWTHLKERVKRGCPGRLPSTVSWAGKVCSEIPGDKGGETFLKRVREQLSNPGEGNREGLGWGSEDSSLCFSSALCGAVEGQMTLAICGLLRANEEMRARKVSVPGKSWLVLEQICTFPLYSFLFSYVPVLL